MKNVKIIKNGIDRLAARPEIAASPTITGVVQNAKKAIEQLESEGMSEEELLMFSIDAVDQIANNLSGIEDLEETDKTAADSLVKNLRQFKAGATSKMTEEQ